MSIQQAMYTSCRTGIEKRTSGFQVYSYTKVMKSIMVMTNVGAMFTYEAPIEGLPIEPTDVEIEELFPKKFSYKIIDEKKTLIALASNQYSGRDYPEDFSRYGNIFSHVLVVESEGMKEYPCQFYKSNSFIKGLSRDELIRTDKPDYLMELSSIEKGNIVNISSVQKFLDDEDRMECFKAMIQCLLFYQDKKLGIDKKLLICDERENIIMWIAALQMAFPLKNALEVTFSDYEYDPISTNYRICGCFHVGTKYNIQHTSQYAGVYLFDMMHGIYPDLDYNTAFSELLQLSFAFSYDSLLHFHKFLQNYNYYNVDNEILDGYELYKILDNNNMDLNIGMDILQCALEFSQKYALETERNKTLNILINNIDKIDILNLDVIGVILGYFKYNIEKKYIRKDIIARKITDYIFVLLSNNNILEKHFGALYKLFIKFFDSIDLELNDCMLEWYKNEEYIAIINKKYTSWKNLIVLGLISQYFENKKLTPKRLNSSQKEGSIIYNIIKNIVEQDNKSLDGFVKILIEAFLFDANYFSSIVVELDYMFMELSNSNENSKILWQNFNTHFIKLNKENRKIVYKQLIFMMQEEKIVKLIQYFFESRTDFSNVFEDVKYLYESLSLKEQNMYTIFRICYQHIYSKGNKFDDLIDLFDYVSDLNLKLDFIDLIVESLALQLPLITNKSKEKIVCKLYNYASINLNKSIHRLELSMLLIKIQEISKNNKKGRISNIAKYKIDISSMRGQEIEEYLQKVGVCLGNIILSTGNYGLINSLFKMNDYQHQNIAFAVFLPIIKYGKKHKDYIMFGEMLLYTMKYNMAMEANIATAIIEIGAKEKEIDVYIRENIEYLSNKYDSSMEANVIELRIGMQSSSIPILKYWEKIYTDIENNKPISLLSKISFWKKS